MRLIAILIISLLFVVLFELDPPRIEYVETTATITDVEYHPLCDVRITIQFMDQTSVLFDQELFESHDIGDEIRVGCFVIPGVGPKSVRWLGE